MFANAVNANYQESLILVSGNITNRVYLMFLGSGFRRNDEYFC